MECTLWMTKCTVTWFQVRERMNCSNKMYMSNSLILLHFVLDLLGSWIISIKRCWITFKINISLQEKRIHGYKKYRYHLNIYQYFQKRKPFKEIRNLTDNIVFSTRPWRMIKSSLSTHVLRESCLIVQALTQNYSSLCWIECTIMCQFQFVINLHKNVLTGKKSEDTVI